MDFLKITQELARMAGMSGGGPPNTEGQSGESQRAVDFVRIAYEEICNLHFDWDFLWATDTIDVTDDFDLYPKPDDLHIWDVKRVFLDGEPLPVIEWADYRPGLYAESGRPECLVIRPDNDVLLCPHPKDDYTLSFDYFKRAEPLVKSNDVPLIPAPYRRVILGRALLLYGNYEAAEDAMKQGLELYQEYLQKLEMYQLTHRQQTHGRQESIDITVTAQ